MRVFTIEAVVHPSAHRQQFARFVRHGRFLKARVERLDNGPWKVVVDVVADTEEEALASAALIVTASGLPTGELRARPGLDADG